MKRKHLLKLRLIKNVLKSCGGAEMGSERFIKQNRQQGKFKLREEMKLTEFDGFRVWLSGRFERWDLNATWSTFTWSLKPLTHDVYNVYVFGSLESSLWPYFYVYVWREGINSLRFVNIFYISYENIIFLFDSQQTSYRLEGCNPIT